MQRYQDTLSETLWQAEGRRPGHDEDDPPLSPALRSESPSTPESSIPTVEIR
jgi:hypothetical protein